MGACNSICDKTVLDAHVYSSIIPPPSSEQSIIAASQSSGIASDVYIQYNKVAMQAWDTENLLTIIIVDFSKLRR